MPKSNDSPSSPSRRTYHFFKIFLPNLSSTLLRIPPAFHPHIEGQAPTRFYLEGPSKYVWGVDLVKRSDGLFFTDGWEEFAVDHSLSTGDFLLFKYNGSSTLSVMIFDNTACEKERAFFARPACDEKLVFSVNEGEKKEKMKTFDGKTKSLKRKKILLDTSNQCSEILMATMWSMQRTAAQALISGGIEEISRNSSNLFSKTFECSSDSMLKFTNTRTKGGCRRKTIRGFLSQRRPITQKEKDDALAKAQSFKSDRPYLLMVMKGSYVYHGFYLTLPGSFPFDHLPSASVEVSLRDPYKRLWPVRYIFSKRPALSGGWGKFAVGNNLEMDDICVFELIDSTHLKVHIFRVLDDVKPLLRATQFKNLTAANGDLKFLTNSS